MKASFRSVIACSVLILLSGLVEAADPVIALPTLGGAHAQANGVNDSGDIVGWSGLNGGGVEATLWIAGAPRGLGVAPSTRFSFATAVNNAGEVVGYSEGGTVPGEPSNPRTATFWGPGGVVDIGAALGFVGSSAAYAINDNGVAVLQGDHPGPFGSSAGWVWSLAQGGTPAGADPIYRMGANYGINDDNDVVGYGAVGFDGAQAILARFNGSGWNTGVEIGPQGVRAPAVANAISDSGIVVGQAGDGGVHVFEAARYTLDPKKPVVWLDKLDDFDDSTALAVNSGGVIVGDCLRLGGDGPEQRAVVWIADRIYDLNHLLRRGAAFRRLISATGVNENDDVVGYGELSTGEIRPFLIREVGRGPTSGLLAHPKQPAP